MYYILGFGKYKESFPDLHNKRPKMSTKGFGGIPYFKLLLFGKGLLEKLKLDIANFKEIQPGSPRVNLLLDGCKDIFR